MFAVTILKLAEGTGFEPVITISKTDALGPTKLTPNKNQQDAVYFFARCATITLLAGIEPDH